MQAHLARRRQFFTSLAQAHYQRGHPLPPQFTGLNAPGYDSSNSPWSRLPLGSEWGKLRVNGKDIDVMQLFSFVMGKGGVKKVSSVSYTRILGYEY